MDATILREAIRRLIRGGGRGSPSSYGYCHVCGQNEVYKHMETVEMLTAIADHAESVPPHISAFYAGIYSAPPPGSGEG